MISEIETRIIRKNETEHTEKNMKGQKKSHMCDTVNWCDGTRRSKQRNVAKGMF